MSGIPMPWIVGGVTVIIGVVLIWAVLLHRSVRYVQQDFDALVPKINELNFLRVEYALITYELMMRAEEFGTSFVEDVSVFYDAVHQYSLRVQQHRAWEPFSYSSQDIWSQIKPIVNVAIAQALCQDKCLVLQEYIDTECATRRRRNKHGWQCTSLEERVAACIAIVAPNAVIQGKSYRDVDSTYAKTVQRIISEMERAAPRRQIELVG